MIPNEAATFPPASAVPVLLREPGRPPGSPWRILLIELVNLIGLFLTHARHAGGARATAVLFDQIVSRLQILEKMPGHDGGMIVRRIGNSADGCCYEKPDYHFLFGSLAFRGNDAVRRSGRLGEPVSHAANALDQTFACLHAQCITALYLQLPGRSERNIDRLRLALNIMARFRQAVEKNASITFRYFGRAMRVPLIKDTRGRPDPNLTMTAGLNGLSWVNMRELIKQARAFSELTRKEKPETPGGNDYNQIFSTRSLRSQLIQPLVEVNNLPWMQATAGVVAEDTDCADPLKENRTPISCDPGAGAADSSQALHPSAFDFTPGYLRMTLDSQNKKLQEAVDGLFDYDYSGTNAIALFEQLDRAGRLLSGLDKASSDRLPFQRVISYLHERLELVPEELLNSMQIQHQAIQIDAQGRIAMIGLVHPKLIDLIVLAKERAATQKRIALFRNHFVDFARTDLKTLLPCLGISGTDSTTVSERLKDCLDDDGCLNRQRFAHDIDALAPYADGVFELLWFALRRYCDARSGSHLLEIMPLAAGRLKDRRHALAILMSDVLLSPSEIGTVDRVAFALATQMLRTHRKEVNLADNTSEEVLAVRKSLDPEMIGYAAWRLDIDTVRVLCKFKTLRAALRHSVRDAGSPPSRQEREQFRSLLSVEREALIFISLVGGKTARLVMRYAFGYYGDPKVEVYRDPRFSPYLSDIMMHLRVILRAMMRLGEPQDLDPLKCLEQSAARLTVLDADPGFARRVMETLQWVAPVIRTIQLQLR